MNAPVIRIQYVRGEGHGIVDVHVSHFIKLLANTIS